MHANLHMQKSMLHFLKILFSYSNFAIFTISFTHFYYASFTHKYYLNIINYFWFIILPLNCRFLEMRPNCTTATKTLTRVSICELANWESHKSFLLPLKRSARMKARVEASLENVPKTKEFQCILTMFYLIKNKQLNIKLSNYSRGRALRDSCATQIEFYDSYPHCRWLCISRNSRDDAPRGIRIQ